MKPLAELDAPPAPTPELLPHDWAPNGECLNPEKVAIDFGAKRGKREAVIFLGLRADGTWRVGYAFASKAGERETWPLVADDTEYRDRGAALRAGLSAATLSFDGDAMAVRTISAMFGQSFGAKEDAAGASLPANTPTATSRPLPPSKPMELPIAAIQPNPENPRTDHPAVAEQELAESIASTGLIQRIAVRKLLPDELGEFPEFVGVDRYEIIAGERRWRAFQRLKRETIPADVFEGLTRAQVKAAALVENGQRLGLNPVDEAIGYRELMATEGLTQEQCAQRVGVSRPVVANALRMLELPAKVLTLVRERKLTVAHAVALARFRAWPAAVDIIAETAVAQGMSAARLETGVPCLTELVNGAAVVQCHGVDLAYAEWPAWIKKHPAYQKINDWSYVCFEPDHWKAYVAEQAADRKKEAEAEAERQRKAAEKAAKNPTKIKSLADLPRNAYASVEGADDLVLKLMPSESVTEVADDRYGKGETKVKISTKPELFRRIEKEVEELKRQDRTAKLPALFEKAKERIAKTKKIAARELTLLFFLAQATDEFQAWFTPAAAAGVNVKLPKGITSETKWSRLALETPTLRRLGEADPCDLWKTLASHVLLASFNEDWDEEGEPDFDQPSNYPACAVLRHVLDLDDLGLLEETKAGQKQLVETVKAQTWYQEAIAAIEGDGKPAKKGSK